LVDMPPREYLGQLARPATLPRFIRAVFDVARTEKDSPRNVIADSRRLSRLEPKTRLLKLANILETPGTYDGALVASIFGAGTAPNWLTRPARKAVAEYAAEVANQARIPAGMDRANYRAYGELIMMGSSQYGMRQAAARYGLRPSAIFFDTAVLQACLSLPAHERMNPRVFKQLMGGAFAGIVPTEVTSRKTKGDYTKHVFQGMRGSQDFLRTIMNDSRLADLGIVDSVKVRASLESGFMGANMPLPSLDMLIASELWLRSLDNESWDQRTRYVAPPPPKTIGTEIAETEPLERQATFGMPDGIIAVTRGHDGGAVIVNMPAKRYQRIKPDAVQILRVLQERGSLAAAYDQLAEIYRAVPRDILERKAEACIRNMIEQGVLSEGISGYTLLHGAADQAIVPPSQVVPNIERTPDVRLRDYTAAFGGLVLGHILQRDPSFERQVRRLGAIRSRLAKQPATPQETTRLLAAARRISRIHLGRAACLELSMATALGAALRGRQAHVVLGVRSDPESFHAWPQAGDVPIRTNADEPIAGIYQPLITL
ncbi:MAG TPA: lasso peptide biosynthesis B2 protein, partial [Candidatus Saccharimonadales bacterium]|nr:lasso peptide biosynthesis B2 protein [Candidatus Saccharimonadales bacterium]